MITFYYIILSGALGLTVVFAALLAGESVGFNSPGTTGEARSDAEDAGWPWHDLMAPEAIMTITAMLMALGITSLH